MDMSDNTIYWHCSCGRMFTTEEQCAKHVEYAHNNHTAGLNFEVHYAIENKEYEPEQVFNEWEHRQVKIEMNKQSVGKDKKGKTTTLQVSTIPKLSFWRWIKEMFKW